MLVVEAPSAGYAWRDATRLVMQTGQAGKDDSIPIKEVLDLFISIENPNTSDIIVEQFGDPKMLDWMINKNFGGLLPVLNWGYSYGMRLKDFKGIDQLGKILSKLQSRPEAKSATISLFDPTTDFSGHMPCIVSLDFKIRDSRLHLTVFIRSQDIVKKNYADSLALGMIQAELAKKLKIKCGNLKMMICSAHIYEPDFVEATRLANV